MTLPSASWACVITVDGHTWSMTPERANDVADRNAANAGRCFSMLEPWVFIAQWRCVEGAVKSCSIGDDVHASSKRRTDEASLCMCLWPGRLGRRREPNGVSTDRRSRTTRSVLAINRLPDSGDKRYRRAGRPYEGYLVGCGRERGVSEVSKLNERYLSTLSLASMQ